MKKQDNQGFTLIELLVAMCILAIVVLPLLHSFVASFRINAKSEITLRATTLAQNEMEIFEKEKIEDLADASRFPYIVTGPDASGCYTFKRNGIINDESGESRFDVLVKLNPQRENAADRYFIPNTTEQLFMNTISAYDSGSYVQTVRNASHAVDYDRMVYGIFNTYKLPEGVGKNWTASDFASRLSRTITVKIFQMDDGTGKITRAKVAFQYTCNEYGVMPAEYNTYIEEKVIYDNAQTFDQDGNRVDLNSVYLFYAPRYDTSLEDVIVIDNEAGLPVNVYVVRQDIWESTVDTVREVPMNYQARLEIRDTVNAEGETAGTYFTNLNLDGPAVAGSGKKLQLQMTDYHDPLRVFTETEIKAAARLKALGAAEACDRIYTMEVMVFDAGADPDTDTPIVTMTGSKLE